MSMIRLLAVIRKETIHITRDLRSLITAILLPLVLMVAYCESLSLDVNNIPMVIIDYDKTKESRDLVDRFVSSGYFSIVEYVDSYRAMQRAIDAGRAVIGLTIPRDFGKLINTAEKRVPLQVLLDGTDPNRGSTANGYTQVIAQNYSQQMIMDRFARLGIIQSAVPIQPRIRIWYNPTLRSKNFLVPGLVAMIMAILAALLTSATVAREWENGTMELLISTPISAFEIVLGKFIPYFIIGLIDSIMIIIVGTMYYHVPIVGSLALLALLIVLFLTGMLLLGLLISCSFRSTLMANQLAFMVTYLPTMLLSGFVFFIPGMPKVLQYLSRIVPATYFLTCSRGIFMKGVGMEVLYESFLFLAIFDMLVIALTIMSFRKTLDT
ncbi:MAG: ABC transporter permease [Candidatus Eremiobacteraeota bacterium]|nr:ABC transporter permease [Candidatus Eremiobacteraeota bacterium]